MLGRSLGLEAAFWSACLILAAAFAVLALAVSGEYELAVDEKVTFGVQALYTKGWADPLFETANRSFDFVPIVLVATGLVIALLARRRIIEAAVVVAAMIPLVLLSATDASIGRPDDIYNAMRANFDGLQYPRIYPSPEGFPSGRAFGGVVVFGLIFWLVPRVTGWWPAIVAVRICCAGIIVLGLLARMYTGYHWFTDCVGGAILGVLVLLIAWRLLQALRRERELVRIEDLVGRKRASANATARG